MSSDSYLPPWRGRLPDGTLGEEYGPRTLTTFQNHCTKSADWAYHRPKRERPEAKLVHEYARAHHAVMPPSIVEAYRLIYVHGMSLSEAADDAGLGRTTIRTYQKRLLERAEAWKGKL